MNKQPDITDATRQAFVDAYCILAARHPDRKLTIREITDLAGYNRTTFYRYFCDADAIREYLEQLVIAEIVSDLNSRALTDQFDEGLFQVFVDVYHNHQRALQILTHENNRSHYIEQVKKATLPIYRRVFASAGDPARIEYAMTIYFTGIFSALAQWMNDPESITEAALLDLIRDLFERWFVPNMKE